MYAAVSSVKNILKSKESLIDNTVFKLHYQLTCSILLVFSIIASSYTFFGDPISCLSSAKDEKADKVFNNYCWAQSTFTLPTAFDQTKVDKAEFPHPGIDKHVPGEQPVVYHSYYQWVCFFLFFQAVSFYIPHFVWKTIEGGKMKSVVEGLDNPIFNQTSNKESNVHKLAEYLERSLGHHCTYASAFLFCQILNFANVVGQLYLANVFLGGMFLEYGSQAIQKDSFYSMTKVFPRVTKCTFRRFGASGDVQNQDLLCILPINIMNEKIFIFLWFWFIVLSIVTGVNFLYYAFLFLAKNVRWKAISFRNRLVNKMRLEKVIIKMDYGDWFFMYILNKNINCLHFNDLNEELYELLELHHLSKMSTTELCNKCPS